MSIKEKLFVELINQMFVVAGINMTYDKLIEDQNKFLKKNPNGQFNWFEKYTWTKEQSDTFMKWAIEYVSKKLRIPKYKGKYSSTSTVSWFLLMHGLKQK